MEADQAHPANIVGQIKRISLKDPAHEILEKVGSSVNQIWSTSAFFNNFRLPDLPVDRAEDCVALTALKMGLYSLQLRETRLAKERDLIVAQAKAEQEAATVLPTREAERKAFAEENQRLEIELDNQQKAAEEKQRLEIELGNLRVQLAASQA
ncbi:unnamed protein product, partial [Cuscuta europaea]